MHNGAREVRMRGAFLPIGLVVALAAVGSHVTARQAGVKPFTDADWPRFAGDLAGTKYSKLTQINTTNVSRLAAAWTFQGVGTQQTPIVVSGVLYASTPTGVVALDADTGSLIWRYGAVPAPGGGRVGGGRRGGGPGAGAPGGARGQADGDAAQDGEPAPPAAAAAAGPQAGGRGPAAPGAVAAPGGAGAGGARGGTLPTAAGPGGAPSSRGLAYWPGDGTLAPRILMTVGRRLVALKAGTGELDEAFGMGGSIDMGVAWGGVPLVYKNIVIVGSNNGEVTQGPSPGDTKAFDARTGAKLWSFASVAQPGDPNHAKSWLDDGWKNRQGVNHWGWYFTLDEPREILYTVFGSPAGNYWGGDRPGANLYGNSVVAVNVNTGK